MFWMEVNVETAQSDNYRKINRVCLKLQVTKTQCEATRTCIKHATQSVVCLPGATPHAWPRVKYHVLKETWLQLQRHIQLRKHKNTSKNGEKADERLTNRFNKKSFRYN